MIIVAHYMRAFNEKSRSTEISSENETEYRLLGVDVAPYYLRNFDIYLLYSSIVGYGIYFGVGGFLHVSFEVFLAVEIKILNIN